MRRGAVVARQPMASSLPELTPVLVAADDEDVTEILRAARAEVAQLSLALRAANHELELAEQRRPELDAALGEVDLAGARQFLRIVLEQHVAARRTELADELEETRTEAARIVASAEERADAHVATAREAALAALLQPAQPLPPLPPLPAAVDDEDGPAAPAPDEPGRETTVSHLQEVVADGADTTALGIASILSALQPVLAAQAVQPSPAAQPALTVRAVRTPRPSLASRLLFADVLLPMIAVVVVLIVLIAWVG